MDGDPPPQSSSSLETRLFYVRMTPCDAPSAPPHLALRINPSTASIPLRRDRIDPSEVTYVTTDVVRIASSVDFEVSDDRGNLILCGTFQRLESPWGNDRSGWSMDCYSAASIGSSGLGSGVLEVYVAGCFGGVPLVLTQTVQVSPRRKNGRLMGGLEVIPEHEEGMIHRSPSSATDEEADEDDPDMKLGHTYHPEGWYTDEDGQLTWFNAGVRVGVGIGLGMCVGIGIGVGLLMRSYQTATRGFKRRFF